MSTKTYHGSCHCQAVQFEADIDLAAGTGKCNCSYCTKVREWAVVIKPEAFRLTAGAEALATYRFGTKSTEHLFCRHCGIRPFGRGDIPELGGAYVGVSLAALDDATPQELAEAPLRFYNGRDNDWWSTPAETRHL